MPQDFHDSPTFHPRINLAFVNQRKPINNVLKGFRLFHLLDHQLHDFQVPGSTITLASPFFGHGDRFRIRQLGG
jgi:hypothetical protein